MRLSAILPVLAATAAALPASAQIVLPGDAVAGLAFARENCADCHDVERRWTDYPALYAPAFIDVAHTPWTTATSLRVFLRSPHVDMPDFILTEQEIDDVVSYILSLKGAVD